MSWVMKTEQEHDGPGFLTAMWRKWITSHNEPNDITIPRKHLFHPVTNVNDIKKLQEQQVWYAFVYRIMAT